MSNPSNKGVNTTDADDNTCSLKGKIMTDVNSSITTTQALLTSEKVVRQVKSVIGPLKKKQLERLCDLMRDLKQSTLSCHDDTNNSSQGPSRASVSRFDRVEQRLVVFSPN